MTNLEINFTSWLSQELNKIEIKNTIDGTNILEIAEALKTASKRGTGRVGHPDIIGQCKDFILIFENKADCSQQRLYTDKNNTELSQDVDAICNYAENGALYYAQHIINNTSWKKVFAFGCSGDEKHYIIRPIFVDKYRTILLPEIRNFENFRISNIDKYYDEQCLGKESKENEQKKELTDLAKKLHEDLRNYAQLGETEKPVIVSAILLALQDKENFKIENLNGNSIKTDGQKIYEAIENYLKVAGVQPEDKKEILLNQFNILKLRPALNTINDKLGKTPIRYYTEFLDKYILNHIVTNISSIDILGNFYGEFMKYSGGDGKGLGVVLTPNHITDLFCELVRLNSHDKVIDPCCGTGGFLVAAMHNMLNSTNDTVTKIKIKQEQLHGIELKNEMFAIATTNMILRGDGKSNLHCGDFLSHKAEELQKENYTVGFMNPPYSQAKNKDTQHLSELCFIKHLLDSLAINGRCAVIIPQSTMIGKTNFDKIIKKEILQDHTLEGVITLNNETFYRIGTNPCIALFTAHVPHDTNKYCKFIDFRDDGYKVNKHIGLVRTERATERKQALLDCWLNNADSDTKFMVKAQVKPEDEWLHSFYYFNDEIPTYEEFEKTVADYLTFEFSMIMQGREYLFEGNEE